VIITLRRSGALVFLVMLVFLRISPTLIRRWSYLALLGTLVACTRSASPSISCRCRHGLAIGIVVDDAIWVVEAVEPSCARSTCTEEATRKAMHQIRRDRRHYLGARAWFHPDALRPADRGIYRNSRHHRPLHGVLGAAGAVFTRHCAPSLLPSEHLRGM